MTQSALTNFLFWCTIINYVILNVWFLALTALREPLYALHKRWFRMQDEQLDRLNYNAMAIYKMLIMVFNLVPYIVLRFIL